MLFHDDFYKSFNALSRRILGELDGTGRPFGPRGRTGPNLNLYEDGNAYTLELELPGFDPESLEVKVEDDELSISGERPAPENLNTRKYAWAERAFGKFNRKLRLGRRVNRDGIEARYENGLLTISIPRAEEAKPRKIKIKA